MIQAAHSETAGSGVRRSAFTLRQRSTARRSGSEEKLDELREEQGREQDRQSDQPARLPFLLGCDCRELRAGGVRVFKQPPIQQPRELGQRHTPMRRFVAHMAGQGAPTHLLRYPALEIGLGRLPQVQVRVEVTPEALDVEQGLLQQDELWLDFDIEAPGSLKQAQQHTSKGNLFEGL